MTGENSKSRQRDMLPQTGDRFNDLYTLAKKLQQKPKQDKTTEEIEFEKASGQCTFAPNIARIHQDLNAGASVIQEDKIVQKEIERMKKAREERERVKKFTERGIILNETSKSRTLHSNNTSINARRPQTVTNQSAQSSKIYSDFAQNSSRKTVGQNSSKINQGHHTVASN